MCVYKCIALSESGRDDVDGVSAEVGGGVMISNRMGFPDICSWLSGV